MTKKNKKTQGGGQQFLSPEKYLQQKARTLEIGTCYVTNDIDKMKMGHVIVTRKHTGGRISMACYLVDMACLGVKDSFYRLRMDDWEFDEFIDDRRDMFRECSYEEAHNRIWGCISYAEEAGIRPDKSFLLTQYMLEEDTDDIPLIEYEYGRDGKHFLTCRSELEASRYLPLMRRNLGEGNYQYIIGIGDPGFDDEEDDELDDERATEHYPPGATTSWNLPIDHLNVADIVGAKPVAGIRFVSHVMNWPLADIEDDGEFRRQYVEWVLQHPVDLLRCLPKREMDMLLYIYSGHEEARSVPVADEDARTMLELACVADAYWDDEDHYRIRPADDFMRVALPLAAGIRMSDEARQRYDVETIVCGLANIYGMVSMEDVVQRMMKIEKIRRGEAEDLLGNAMEHSLVLRYMLEKVRDRKKIPSLSSDEIFYFSTYAWDDQEAMRKAIANGGINTTDRREFTDEEVRQACLEEPPTVPNARRQQMWQYLTRVAGWDDYYAHRICSRLWNKVNHEGEPDYWDADLSIEDYFKDEALIEKEIEEDPSVLTEAMRILHDYVDHIPRWTLRGYAPAEL